VVLSQAELDEDLLRANFYGAVDTGGRRLKTFDFYRQPAKYGSVMCLLNCAHSHKANSKFVHMPSRDFDGQPTIEGWMKIQIAVRGGTELMWDYDAITCVKSEAIPCCCGAFSPGGECWVVKYVNSRNFR
jgi:hypothetical protein